MGIRTKFAVVTLLLGTTCLRSQSPPKFPSRVRAVTARLFYESTGTFSGDILATPDLALWNTIIGEGESGGASRATLITVEVDGDGGPNAIHREVLSVTTQEEGKPERKHLVRNLFFSESGKSFEAV